MSTAATNASDSGGAGRIFTWRGAKELALELVFYGGPAFLLSRYLMSLTGGALWVPPEWRRVILALGFAGGLALFHLARIHVVRVHPRPERQAAPAPGEARRRNEANAFTLRRAFGWFAATVAAVAGHSLLRASTVHAWSPSPELVRALAEYDVAPPLYLEPGGPPHRGSLLFPLGFPSSAGGRALVDELRYARASDSAASMRAEAIDHRLLDLVDVIRDDEHAALGLTQVAFVVTHLVVLAFASISYGYSFSWAEEVGGQLREWIGA
jgi:hypothetical protein